MSYVKLNPTEYSSVVRSFATKRIEIHERNCVYSSSGGNVVCNEELIWGDKPCTFKGLLDNYMRVQVQ